MILSDKLTFILMLSVFNTGRLLGPRTEIVNVYSLFVSKFQFFVSILNTENYTLIDDTLGNI